MFQPIDFENNFKNELKRNNCKEDKKNAKYMILYNFIEIIMFQV